MSLHPPRDTLHFYVYGKNIFYHALKEQKLYKIDNMNKSNIRLPQIELFVN